MNSRRGGEDAGDRARRLAGGAEGLPADPDVDVTYEVEVIPGLEEFAEREMRRTLGASLRTTGRPAEGRIAISYPGDPRRFDGLKSIVAVYAVQTFDVPRPRALLGHAHLTRLLRLIGRVVGRYPPGSFTAFRVSAAGSETAVFARMKDEIGRATGLRASEDQVDLLVAVRRAPDGRPGWQVLTRLQPRPLSARPWRVCNLPGALNATVAHAMAELAGPRRAERFLNVACGSGTLMIERLELGPAGVVVGADVDAAARNCARANLAASGYAREALLLAADAASLPFPAGAFDTIVTDLPFGMLMGSTSENARLYPRFLAEASRVAAPGATLVVITAGKRLFESALGELGGAWGRGRIVPIKLPFEKGYLRPSIYVFRRVLI